MERTNYQLLQTSWLSSRSIRAKACLNWNNSYFNGRFGNQKKIYVAMNENLETIPMEEYYDHCKYARIMSVVDPDTEYKSAQICLNYDPIEE